ncbi:hypothetical protein TanjilG_15939 [Lupinus angustifolius]|uniref:Uncharacterized protein n=1 Tax=Lupinus angustifolius TaxID=3871 RepID=A0A4P1RGH0_LUPAN|nr:PREDICTED: uncharacterized protein LOC109349196 [Lupinus angustifolius]XP_019445458.1 PREDICTED: uncharacterized protein LOC109349196 [Lupinus angustifolius]OIW10567.1 hypothetical protein TanjilG_15939 [Lupinus angustifolius]
MQTDSGEFELDLMANLRLQDENEYKQIHEQEEEEDEEEFTFMFTNPDGSPISADGALEDGQILPVFPVFDQDLLFSDDYDGASGIRSSIRKVFVQNQDNFPSSSAAEASESGSESDLAAPAESYCEWTPKSAVKSNSTGFSKLWRFKEHKLRSNSDGKDAFVFLHPPPTDAEKASSGEVRNVVVKKVKGKTTSSSAHEKNYVMYRAKKENEKHKSYLPYKQDLFGFFTNANGLSRNLHPY